MGLIRVGERLTPVRQAQRARSRMRSTIAIVPASDLIPQTLFCRANTIKLM